ncbi:polyketide synthase [Mycobacterium sp. TNTM28]|uniref:Polyketide synthase n=2 Tax=[Mycobacterium] fortunisiensis TaxID=2600579 RepID=A0ABS6KN21_9MYCO|nr:polyketide synthase [[Mycobacterium] fortunisiensis]
MAASVIPDASGTGSWITDYGTAGPPLVSDLESVWSSLDDVLTAELCGARAVLGCTAEDLLLAALGRAVARTIGDGLLTVDLRQGRERKTCRRIEVPCVSQRGLSGAELLAVAYPGPGDADRTADITFSFGKEPETDVCGPPLAVRISREGDSALKLQWRFDTRVFDHCTVEELTEQFPLSLIEITCG